MEDVLLMTFEQKRRYIKNRLHQEAQKKLVLNATPDMRDKQQRMASDFMKRRSGYIDNYTEQEVDDAIKFWNEHDAKTGISANAAL